VQENRIHDQEEQKRRAHMEQKPVENNDKFKGRERDKMTPNKITHTQMLINDRNMCKPKQQPRNNTNSSVG